jgi:hypothetical protein
MGLSIGGVSYRSGQGCAGACAALPVAIRDRAADGKTQKNGPALRPARI